MAEVQGRAHGSTGGSDAAMTTGFVSRFIVLRPLSPDARRITDRDMGLVPCEGAGSLRTFSSAWSASSAILFGIAGVARLS